MNLTEQPDIVMWPETHYVYLEKIGPFQETAMQSWKELQQLVPTIAEHGQITGYMALYKMEPGKMTYRAGVSLASMPEKLPAGLEYQKFPGGKYSRFLLTGPYSDLPMASRRVFEIVNETQIERRDDFCIEHYVNDPKTTPEDQLKTEILIPTA